MVTASAVVAPIVALVHLGVHALFIGLKKNEALFIGLVTAVGVILDQILFSANVFLVDGAASFAPVWLSCLWPVLATTFMHAFETLQKHLALAAVVGAVGGTLSYIAGTRLSNVEFASAEAGPLVIAALWFVVMPLLLLMARRFSSDGGGEVA